MANKEQAIHSFWGSFGWAAYDEGTVPVGSDAPTLPYITYRVVSDSLYGGPIAISASLWDRSSSWAEVTQKCNQISEYIGIGGRSIPVDGGYVWIKRGAPFAQRVVDDDDMVRRIYINISVDFLTEN